MEIYVGVAFGSRDHLIGFYEDLGQVDIYTREEWMSRVDEGG